MPTILQVSQQLSMHIYMHLTPRPPSYKVTNRTGNSDCISIISVKASQMLLCTSTRKKPASFSDLSANLPEGMPRLRLSKSTRRQHETNTNSGEGDSPLTVEYAHSPSCLSGWRYAKRAPSQVAATFFSFAN